MKNNSILNLKTKVFAILFSLIIIASIFHINGATVNAVTEVGFGGYIESSLPKSVITVEGISDKTVTDVKINGESVTYSVSGNEITVDKPISPDDSNPINDLTLGQEYSLSVLTNGGEYLAKFRYVTLAIRTASDLKFFNVTSQEKNNRTLKTGYYVLANDIAYDKSFASSHQGTFSDKYTGEYGFSGTFDGQGYSVSFKVGKNGLFGGLKNAVIKNVAFLNVVTNNSSVLSSCVRGSLLIENVYCRTVQGRMSGLVSIFNKDVDIKLKNVISEFSYSMADYKSHGSAGALIGYDVRLVAGLGRNFEESYQNVYAISKCSLGKYCFINSGTNELTREDYYLAENEEYKVGTANSSKTFVIENIRKYDTLNDMKKDTANDYSGFDTKYWDLSYGVPVFTGTEDDLTLTAINGVIQTYLTIYTNNEKNTCEIAITLDTIPIAKETVLEITQGAECVSVNGNVLTAVKDGTVKVKVTAKDGSFAEQTVTVFVETESQPILPPNDQQPSEQPTSEFPLVPVLIGGIGGVAVIAGVALTVVFLKKKKTK